MKIWDIADILQNNIKGNVTAEISNPESEIKMLLTDSRNHFLPEETLFFAIKTPGGNDGHRFIKELFDKGVRNFIVEEPPKELSSADLNLIIVPDSIEALTEIGKINKKNAKEIVAICGSRGKTTLKEMIFQLLEPYKKISRSPRSYNSKIGVPLSLWQIPKDTDLALIEAGISKRGEMQRLSDAIEPSTVILTNIGEAHSQGFGSMEEKAEEKSLMAFGRKVERVIYPFDDPLISNALSNLPIDKKRVKWSLRRGKQDFGKADLYISPLKNGIKYEWKGESRDLNIPISKDFELENIAGALAFMLDEGLSHNQIKERFSNFHRIKTRLNVSEGINGCSLILDSYTSDLSSLLPAIDFMRRRKNPNQTITLILSDLRHESGDNETYREIAEIVEKAGVKKFIGIGEVMASHPSLFPKETEFYKDTDEFLKAKSPSDFENEIILLKGSPDFDFAKIYESLEAKKHETVLEVNLDAMLRNYNYFRSKVPSSTGIISMVKASGYGAGSYEIAKTLQDAGAAYLAVAAIDEGADLRKNGIVMPIMVMNPRSANYLTLFRNRLEPVVYSIPMLKEIVRGAEKGGIKEYPIHIKLDTGMHRMGFEESDLNELITLLLEAKNIKVATIFSHLATADCLDMDFYTHRQLQRFEKMSGEIMSALDYSVKRHILNSAGILRFPQYHYDLVRLGIGLYGANTLPPDIEQPLSVVSSLLTVIICIREVEAGEAVGYGRKGEIGERRRIATLPIGYADGMNRHFGNGRVEVMVNGHRAPTIGNICMDATMIDVTGIDCKEGDSVEIFGENMSVQALADTLDTIPYEILTSVSPRVKRIYYRE